MNGLAGARHVLKLYASCGIDISKCIEGGSMKLATQVDYIFNIICNGSRRYFRVMNVFIFFYLVKAKPLREPEELPI